MDTKIWGPPGWKYLHTLTFNYPTRIDLRNSLHKQLKKYIKEQFINLQYTLPCKYCRQSFKDFIKKLPIKDYLDSRADLTWWLYSIHNMVNEKLRKQEQALFDKELKKMVNKAKKEKWKAPRVEREYKRLQKILFTGPDPSFGEVCKKYESFRASCSAIKNGTKTCRRPPRFLE